MYEENKTVSISNLPLPTHTKSVEKQDLIPPAFQTRSPFASPPANYPVL